MKGYKAFNADMTCRGFRYEVGKTYEMDSCKLCDHGFHFCKNIRDCFTYYFDEDTRFAEIEAYGDIKEAGRDTKCVTNKIRIVKEIPHDEAVSMTNAGNWNTGTRNTGDGNTGNGNAGNENSGHWNTGNGNIGRWNTGDGNTGDWNSGDWNTADCSSGCFCTGKHTILLFDKPSNLTFAEWYSSHAANLLRQLKGTDKSSNSRQKWWDELGEKDKEIVKAIPNFNARKFYECTGINVD